MVTPSVSVIDPIARAIDRTKAILFRPFLAGKWFGLGFCAWLATLGGTMRGCGLNFRGGRGRGGPFAPPPGFEPPTLVQWIDDNFSAALGLGLVGLVAGLGLWALVAWLSSRGHFMFIDGLVHNRGLVKQPWAQFKEEGDNLFAVTFVLGLIGMGFLLVLSLLCLALAWRDLQAQTFGSGATAALLLGVLVGLPATIAISAATLLLRDFVAPTMYLRRIRAAAAWEAARSELIAGHVGTIVLFYLMRIVLGVAVGVLACAAVCVTCAIPAIPYIGTVVLLPLYVFDRCYTLCFLEQYGPAWFFVGELPLAPTCSNCGYDLRGSVSGFCPECGTAAPTQYARRDNGIAPPPAPPSAP